MTGLALARTVQGAGRRVASGNRGITPSEFGLFQDLVQREAGIYLSEVKHALLVGRLARRLRELGLTSFGAYYRLVKSDAEERVRMLDCICTNETHFFREPRQFEFLERVVLPAWRAEAEAGRRPRRVRAWSAACSTGEEPYSLAMMLLATLPGWEVGVQATDLSTRVLERAGEAVWPLSKSGEIPERFLKAYMLRGVGSQEGRMKAGPEIRSVVRFERLNLNDDAYAVPGPFDLLFCRNVLIYFDPPSKARVLERLIPYLAPSGLLFLGHAESPSGLTSRLRSVGPTVYAPSAGSGDPGRRL
jgi:chemotaxis protein methyltransferase CheR